MNCLIDFELPDDTRKCEDLFALSRLWEKSLAMCSSRFVVNLGAWNVTNINVIIQVTRNTQSSWLRARFYTEMNYAPIDTPLSTVIMLAEQLLTMCQIMRHSIKSKVLSHHFNYCPTGVKKKLFGASFSNIHIERHRLATDGMCVIHLFEIIYNYNYNTNSYQLFNRFGVVTYTYMFPRLLLTLTQANVSFKTLLMTMINVP